MDETETGAGQDGAEQSTTSQESLLGAAQDTGTQQQQDMTTGADESQQDADTQTGYTQFTVPEGFTYDDGAVSEFTTLAKELNLTQEQAQKLVDLHTRHWLGFEETMRQQQEKWRQESMNDAEFGGRRFAESLVDARRFVEMFGGEPLRAALEEAGVGNHPALFRAFARAGRLLGEDRFAGGVTAPTGRTGTFADLANSMYPDMRG